MTSTIAFLDWVTWRPDGRQPGGRRTHRARIDLVPAAVAAAIEKGNGFRHRRGSRRRCRHRYHHAAQWRSGEAPLRRDPARRRRAPCSSTARPSRSTTREVNRLAADHGFAQLDAPVSGGVKGAVAGTLASCGGRRRGRCRAARAVLEPMAGKVVHCGAAGAGQAAKLCNNMVLAVQQIAVGEAFVLAEKLGLPAQSLFDVITGATGNCWRCNTNCPECQARFRRHRPTTSSNRASPPP